jgi:integrase
VDGLKGRDKYLVALAGFAGLRRGEIAGLKWEDVDFKNNTIRLVRQYTNGRLENLKTSESEATVPICPKLTVMLKEWRVQSFSPEWVFKGKGPLPFAIHSWAGDEWRRIRVEFNLPDGLRFHDLRHTFASILLAHNAQPGDVQKLLRHTSLRTTMDIYRHVLPGQLERKF